MIFCIYCVLYGSYIIHYIWHWFTHMIRYVGIMIAYKRTMIFDGSVFGHLQEQNVRPEHMAVDKPSDKFLAFLRKHYGLSRTIPQINNFVVFDAFFQDRPSKCLL